MPSNFSRSCPKIPLDPPSPIKAARIHEEYRMKLKQRVIMMSTMFLSMLMIFLIGTRIAQSFIEPESSPSPEQPTPSVAVVNTDSLKKIEDGLKDLRAPNDFLDQLRPSQDIIKQMLMKERGLLENIVHLPIADSATIQPRPKVDPWELWSNWVSEDYFYPEDKFYSEEMNVILEAMSTKTVTEFGIGHRGTQLKTTMMLGAQRTVFKPKRYTYIYTTIILIMTIHYIILLQI